MDHDSIALHIVCIVSITLHLHLHYLYIVLYILHIILHPFLHCLACLSESSALSKMGRLWALTFTPVIVMTFEFCQRGATVDTPFLTVLKTWTSPFELSVIILVSVRLELPEVSATRLASGSPNSTV